MCCLTFELSCAQRRAMPLGVSLSEGLGRACATNMSFSVPERRCVRLNSWCFTEDGGRSSGVGLQGRAPNRHKLLG